MKAVPAIKEYMESDPHGRKVTMDELKDLDKSERQELGRLCADALGVEFEAAQRISETRWGAAA